MPRGNNSTAPQASLALNDWDASQPNSVVGDSAFNYDASFCIEENLAFASLLLTPAQGRQPQKTSPPQMKVRPQYRRRVYFDNIYI